MKVLLKLLLAVPLFAGWLFAGATINTNLNISGSASVTVGSGNTVNFNFTGTSSSPELGAGIVSGTGSLVLTSGVSYTYTVNYTITFASTETLIGQSTGASTSLTPGVGISIGFSGATNKLTGGTGQYGGANGTTNSATATITAASFAALNQAFTLSFGGPITANLPNYGTSFSNGLRFVPVTPCRILDTRNANGAFGGPALAANTPRDFYPWSSGCGIPTSATAYSVNVTVVPLQALQFLSMWPTGQAQPFVSTLNSFDARIKANAAIIPGGNSGGITVMATNPTHLILDVNGYFESNQTSDYVFYPVAPCRLVDTRNPPGSLAGPIMQAGETRTFPLLNSPCGLPSAARAYALNMTVVPSQPLSFLTTWPTGQGQPLVSTLNAPTGTIVANAAIVPAGNSGSINVFVTDQTHVIIDVNGYFAPQSTGGLAFYPLNPCRMVDTRNPAGLFGGPSLQGGVPRSFPLLSSNCAPPTQAQVYSMNVTSVPNGSLGYLTLWPIGVNQPGVSTLNAVDGAITSNAAIIPNTNGAIYAFASNTSDVIFDINGYFAP